MPARRCRARHPYWPLVLLSTLLIGAASATTATTASTVTERQDAVPLDFAHIAALRRVTHVAISPDGQTTAFLVSVPRQPGVDEDGPAWTELHVATTEGTARPFVHGAVNVSNPRFDPSGAHVLYLAARGDDENKAIWALPINGGESHEVLAHAISISAFECSPDGQRLAFIATTEESEARTKRTEQGFTEEVVGEDGHSKRVWIVDLPPLSPTVPTPVLASDEDAATDEDDEAARPTALAIEGSVSRLAWAPDSASLVVAVAPGPSVDHGYMLKRLRRVEASSGEVIATFDNPGKLGGFAFSPDGRYLAMISAQDFNDPKDGRILVAPASGGPARDLLPGLEAHVSHLAWRDAETLIYVADHGTATEVGTISIGGQRHTLARSGIGGAPVVTRLAVAGDAVAFIGERPSHPPEAFRWIPDQDPSRLSDVNPWLASMTLAEQEVVSWKTRDGLALEGILIHPLEPTEGPAPLMMIVHGGPEGHVRNGWVTSYSRPGQLAAAQGYAVFYPNYRGSTGRGVAFSKLGQGDAAGPEFDDLIDGIDHLVQTGIADRDRVGVTGGSYGGYATAWCATRFTDRFRAGVMLNGIANKHSKALTTDIPEEDRAVHTLFDPWTRASFALERSPLSFVEQSRTPLLIAGGAADPRVHPSQSLQLWNALRLLDNAPVRLVRYPGEPHGNRRAAARDDYTRRLMRWMNHFVLDGGKEAPPWELER